MGEQLDLNDARTDYLAQRLELTQAAINTLWCEQSEYFYCKNVLTNSLAKVKTSAALLTVYAGLTTDEQTRIINTATEDFIESSQFSVASTHPKEEKYEPQRYWRGPIWLHINWMITLGLEDYGFFKQAKQVTDASRNLIYTSGFNESFHAETGARSGGADFSWTAAMALYWLLPNQE